ncbi:MAG: penicillin acylase family protein [Pyrinomonadaceae bacterium MAG19_C2-C3]|nr:penicillin acylase family protein [Pyrinomonadaceae bacterium MAG19_C2-C3]
MIKFDRLLTLLLAVSLLVCVVHATPAQAPPASTPNVSSLKIAGLRATVTVRRDGRGVPYIEAANEDDLYFAQGYVTASDRLWQMDLLRRTARGELSEIFGRATLEEDKRRRIYGFARLSQATERNLAPDVRRVLAAYAKGVNAFIQTLDEKSLPPEFRLLGVRPRAWQIADSLVVGKIFAELLSRPWRADIERLALSDIPPAKLRALTTDESPFDVFVVGNDDKTRSAASTISSGDKAANAVAMFDDGARRDVLRQLAEIDELTARAQQRLGLYGEALAASNNWVVAGKRSASGKPLLANDPHLPASAPSIWYMAHLSAPNFRVTGVTAAGAPGIIIGHNERVAWGVTNTGPDVQDVYLETFDDANPRRYKTPNGFADAEIRQEEIKVRKSLTAPETESVTLEVTVTRHGPVVFEAAGKRYALRWTALDSQRAEFAAFYKINRATNWQSFTRALSVYSGSMQNFVYADRAGHIGYYAAGFVPMRKTGDGSVPYDGATDAGEWTDFIPFAELPHVYDPPSGIIVTANNRIIGRSYKHFLTNSWAAPYRARRIYDLLNAKPKHDLTDFARIQYDVYSVGGKFFADEAYKILSMRDATTDREAMPHIDLTLKLLQTWNGEITPDSRGAAFVSNMRTAFRARVVAAVIGAERAKSYRGANVENFADMVLRTQEREWLPKEFSSYADLLIACARDAHAELTRQPGADETKWTWGATSKARFPHPLASVPIFGTPFVIEPFAQRGSGFAAGATVNVGANVSMRLLSDTGDWDKTRQIIAPGQSGNPASPHWKDQLGDWQSGATPVFPFTAEAVRGAARSVLRLEAK